MRTLMLGRVFSGLKEGLQAGQWAPRGVPAFYKLVEGLKAAPDCTLLTVLASKDDDPRFTQDATVESAKAGTVKILGWRRITGGLVRKLDVLATEIVQLFQVLGHVLWFRPDVVYATYAMVIPAALACRLFGTPVIVRLMGIFPNHRAMVGKRWSVYRWALRSPFRAVVCTEDGSDPGAVLPKLIHPDTELVLRLNGCDVAAQPAPHSRGEQPLAVLFVGRLESYKGCDVFIDAALECLSAAGRRVRFEVVGDGPLRSALEAKVAAAGQSGSIAFAAALPHHEVMQRLLESDIYVSVNFNGNLSNANLEALAAGTCLVIPTSDPAIPLDTSTDRLLPDGVVVRYDRFKPVQALAGALNGLIDRPERIGSYRAAVRSLAPQLLKSWAARIEDDIALLRKVAAECSTAPGKSRMRVSPRL